jgi:glycerol-3-phosphate acyltransferase PlsY
MQIILFILVLLVAYIAGSIPFGLVIVKLRTGKDIRQVESGRTGGTNAMRAAGFGAGLATAIFDMLKSAAMVWLAQFVLPGNHWVAILAPVMATLGHNYSIFLIERDENGRPRLRGGAGGAPCVGGSVGLWFPSIFIIVPMGALMLYFVGYASLATMSVAITSTLIFAYRAWAGASPWEYAVYGLISLLLLMWALRPNIRRLLNGTERLVGLRAKRKAALENK